MRETTMGLLMFSALVTCTMGTIAMEMTKTTETIEYRKEVDRGDTVWSICASVATDEDNMQELVRRTLDENNIGNSDDIYEGQTLVIHVKRHHYFFNF